MKNSALRNALVTLGSFIFVVTVVSAWNPPTGTPPDNNVPAPITSGVVDQEKLGSLRLASLHSLGAIRIGNSTSECTALLSGAIRWTGTAMEYCDGIGPTWSAFGGTTNNNVGLPAIPGCAIVYPTPTKLPDNSYPFIISTKTNFNLYTMAKCSGINVAVPQSYTVTVAPSVDVQFVAGTLVSGSSIKIVNNGRIVGAGGAGGAGGVSYPYVYNPIEGWYECHGGNGDVGGTGFPAITLTNGVPTSIDNRGTIVGGGGGGGGGGSGTGSFYPVCSGAVGGAGGTGAGYAGSATGGLAGASTGGSGGGYGGTGSTGGSLTGLGGAGGAPGNAVKLNGATITWISGNDATHVIGAVN